MACCATELIPKYNYDQPILAVGVYRPPGYRRPPYKEALDQMSTRNKTQNITTFIVGDLDINSWDKEYEDWSTKEELWVLADP